MAAGNMAKFMRVFHCMQNLLDQCKVSREIHVHGRHRTPPMLRFCYARLHQCLNLISRELAGRTLAMPGEPARIHVALYLFSTSITKSNILEAIRPALVGVVCSSSKRLDIDAKSRIKEISREYDRMMGDISDMRVAESMCRMLTETN